jgi:hypothetical protein
VVAEDEEWEDDDAAMDEFARDRLFCFLLGWLPLGSRPWPFLRLFFLANECSLFPLPLAVDEEEEEEEDAAADKDEALFFLRFLLAVAALFLRAVFSRNFFSSASFNSLASVASFLAASKTAIALASRARASSSSCCLLRTIPSSSGTTASLLVGL